MNPPNPSLRTGRQILDRLTPQWLLSGIQLPGIVFALACSATAAPPVVPMAAWQNTYFTPAQIAAGLADDLAVTATDPTPNLLKYAYGLAPTDPAASVAPQAGLAGSHLTLQYRRASAATDVIYDVEVSSDLQTWASGPGATEILTTSALQPGVDLVTVRDLQAVDSAHQRFLRLRVSRSLTSVLAAHPRMFLNSSQMSALLHRAGYAAPGVPLSDATPAASWTAFSDWMQPYRTDGTYYSMWGWHFALMYMITRDHAYFDRALAFLTENMTAVTSGAFGLGNGATDPLDYCMDAYGESVRFTNYIGSSSYLRDAALIYDWFYPELTPAKRQQIVAYINRIEGEIWDPLNQNGQPDWSGWSAWGINDSGDNFHYGHTTGLIYAAAAVSDPAENPNPPTLYLYPKFAYSVPDQGVAYHDYPSILAAVEARDAEYLNTYAKGAAWFEGDSYGNFCKSHMMEGLFVQTSAFGVAPTSPPPTFINEAALYFLYAAQPAPDGAGPTVNIFNALTGDTPNYGQYLKDSDRVSLLEEASCLGASNVTAGYVRSWLQAKYPSCNYYRDLFGYDFLLDASDASLGDLSELPPYLHATGAGWVNSRSQAPRGLADPDAVSVSFMSCDRIQSHQHQDANAFLVYYKDWQIAKAAPYMTGSGFPWGKAKYQSHIQVADANGPAEQRYSNDLSGGNGFPDRVHPSGKIVKYESTPAYTYAVGDASDSYYTDVNSYGPGTTRLLNIYLREFVHLRPDVILLYDRVSPVDVSTQVSYQIVTHYQPLVLSATDRRSINGDGEVFQRTLLPSANFSIVSSEVPDIDSRTPGVASCYRTTTQTSDPAPAHQTFFHLLQTADATTSAMVATSPIAAGQAMNGVLIHYPGQDTAVLFAANDDGASAQGPISYGLGANTATRHLVFDLPLAAGYTITDVAGTITLTPGGTTLVSANGSLAFSTDSQGNVTLP